MNLTLKIWRQANTATAGEMTTYQVDDVSQDMSFLEMLDVLNEELNAKGEEPGRVRLRLPRGHLRHVRPGDQRRAARPARPPPPASCTCARSPTATTITIEPWRSAAFPVLKDLVVDRRAFDRIIAAGRLRLGHHRRGPRRARRPRCPRTTPTVPSTRPPASAAAPAWRPARTGRPRCSSAPRSPTSASCPRARPSADSRVVDMVAQHDAEGFGGCTNIGQCTAACPKEIPIDVISQLNRDLRTAIRKGH